MDPDYQYGDGVNSPMFCSIQSASSPTPSLVPNLNPPSNSNPLNLNIFQSQKYTGLELAFFFRDCSYYHHIPKTLLIIFFQTCKSLL